MKEEKASYKATNIKVQEGAVLMEQFLEKMRASGLKGGSVGFSPTDDSGNPIGLFEVEAYDADEEKCKKTLGDIAESKEIKNIVNPGFWVKAWNWLKVLGN